MEARQPFRLSGTPAAVTALLVAARAKGVSVNRTKMVKLLYFADLRAVRDVGRPGSGVVWKWLDHGPFNPVLYDVERDLEDSGVIQREQVVKDYGGTETQMRLVGAPADLDIDEQFAKIIGGIVAEYGHMAASTLRNMSYDTEPMREAQRGGARGVVLDLFGGQPAPQMGSLLRRMQERLNASERREDEGNPEEMLREYEETGPGRARAQEVFGE